MPVRWGRCALALALAVSALGCAHRTTTDASSPEAAAVGRPVQGDVAFYLEAESGRADALKLAMLHPVDGAPVEVSLQPQPVVARGEVATVAMAIEDNGFAALDLRLDPSGAQHLRQVTADNVGKRMAVVAAGRVLTVATVMGEIGDGKVRVAGLNFVDAQTVYRRLTEAAPAR